MPQRLKTNFAVSGSMPSSIVSIYSQSQKQYKGVRETSVSDYMMSQSRRIKHKIRVYQVVLLLKQFPLALGF